MDDAWCPDIMKQLAAVQGMLEGTSREVFRHHLESHVAEAIRAGRGDEIVDEGAGTSDGQEHPTST